MTRFGMKWNGKSARYKTRASCFERAAQKMLEGHAVGIEELNGWARFNAELEGDDLRIEGRYTHDQKTELELAISEARQ